ncbi:FUSC family protein [Clostridium niameyense]|uniref:FUSC family protein n=1 Tax=Clostridium niameyense TaxID=1622073 RepID=UPI00067F11BF|nr:FUSC family protein [Clostridium niameyense]
MNKKLIISKTILFILIVSFIIAFKATFGAENTLIGVTTVTAMLMLLERDLTLSPIKNTVFFIILNLFIGITAYLSNLNMYLAVPLNFLVLFIINYLLCYNLKKPIYLPFSLQYLFILATPITIDKLPMRLTSLLCGAIFIMLLQLIFNKNKLYTKGTKILIEITSNLLNKINLIKTRENTSISDNNIRCNLINFQKLIYEKREENFYLTEEGRIKLNLSIGLEKLSLLLDKVNFYKDKNYILDDMYVFITHIKGYLEKTEDINTLNNLINEFLYKYEQKNIEDLIELQILNTIKFLQESFEELKSLQKNEYNIVKRLENIPEKFKDTSFTISDFKKNSFRFSYAFRVALGITIGAFIMDFFHLSEGRWIIYTVFSLINPLYEISKKKTKDRIIATIIGAIIVTILFTVFKNTTTRTMILLMSGYLGSYTSEYKHNMIYVTISAIGAAALLGNTKVITINRILFVILGALIASVINKFVLPYKIKDSNKNLKSMYKNTIKQMLQEIYNLSKSIENDHSIKNLLLITSLIEDKLRLNNQLLKPNKNEYFITKDRVLASNIYELYLYITKNKIDIDYLLKDIQQLVQYENKNISSTIEVIKIHIKEFHNIRDKLVLSLTIDILTDINEYKII